MEYEKLKRKTILRLKEIKSEQGLSIAQIAEILEKRGEFVSTPTLKKVFCEGSENKNYNYQATIAPLADVLLDIYGDNSEVTDIEGLKEIIRQKNKTIELLMIKIEEQEEAYVKKEALYKERQTLYEHNIQHLEAEVNKLNEHLDNRERCIERKDLLLEKLVDASLLKEDEIK